MIKSFFCYGYTLKLEYFGGLFSSCAKLVDLTSRKDFYYSLTHKMINTKLA